MFYKTAVSIVLALTCFINVSANQDIQKLKAVNSRLESALDRMEGAFWRGLFAPYGSDTKNAIIKDVDELQLAARSLQTVLNALRIYYINPTGPVSKIKNMISTFRPQGVRSFNPGCKKSSYGLYLRQMKRNNPSRKRNAPVTVSLESYEDFLQGIMEHNIARVQSRANTNRSFSNPQRRQMVNYAEQYYSAISELRIAIFKVKQLK